MGSIQGLRAEGLALRAKEDTNLQISGHLGSVNKSLGAQITGIIDQLQGIIGERTKAYNTSMIKLVQTIDGKNGIGEKGMDTVFKIFNVIETAAGLASITGPVADAVAAFANIMGSRSDVSGAVFDYEKGVSQLGYTYITPSDSSLPGNKGDQGAVAFVYARNALMAPYSSAGHKSIAGTPSITRYYIGALRKH